MEILHHPAERRPRVEGSRIVYPILRYDAAISKHRFWSSTAHLKADVLDVDSTVFLVHEGYHALTSGECPMDFFPLVHAIFADWRYLEANPRIDPVDWIAQRTHLFSGEENSKKIIGWLQASGWLAPRKAGIEIAARYNVVRDHRTGRPQNRTYAFAFSTSLGHYLTVKLHPLAARNRHSCSSSN